MYEIYTRREKKNTQLKLQITQNPTKQIFYQFPKPYSIYNVEYKHRKV